MLKIRSNTIYSVDFQMFKFLLYLVTGIVFLLTSCVSQRSVEARFNEAAWLEAIENNNYLTGLLVVDLQTKDTLVRFNAKKYFTPASTVKVVTLYSANKLLGKRVPTLTYTVRNDTIFAAGTGDPSWLHPHFQDRTASNFLQRQKHIALFTDNFRDDKFGPGWAWEDYTYSFSAERSGICLHGNVVTLSHTDTLHISPGNFTNNVIYEGEKTIRDQYTNTIYIPESFNDTLEIPFITDAKVIQTLLQEELGKSVALATKFPSGEKQVLFGQPSDSIYRRMLYTSDNFLAEQLMVNAASTLSDTLSFELTKNHILENYLTDVKQEPRWVDGSGLSRYNLFSPESLVDVLSRLWAEMPQKRLFHLFPLWDANGTVPLEKEKESTSFIHGKSGSMGNIYNLCGYLKTTSGRYLAFSFMNNHTQRPLAEIREKMFKTLNAIRYSN